MDRSGVIKRLLNRYLLDFKEQTRTITKVQCPKCDRNDKFSILKQNGHCICYHGGCQFKGWLEDFVRAKQPELSYKEAKELIYGYRADHSTGLKITVKVEDEETFTDVLPPPIMFPDPMTFPISSQESLPGRLYLESRGIPLEVAEYYNLHYCVPSRRVIIPLEIEGMVYGWQGRATFPTDPGFRLRNNVGFPRTSAIAFYNQLLKSKYGILSEGPFDAIKFHKVGGNIATFGVALSDAQIKLILDSNIEKLYAAYDEDEAGEAAVAYLSQNVALPLYRVLVPESCKARCKQINKKADFGECTFDECVQAFKDAKPIARYAVSLKLK